jgi:hypothetical protein
MEVDIFSRTFKRFITVKKSLLFSLCLLLSSSLELSASDRFAQTTANPDNNILQIRLRDNWFEINLATPGIKIERYPNGTLREIFVQMVNVSYYIQFYPIKPYTTERIASIKRYQSFSEGSRERLLLHGKTESYDESSRLISEVFWEGGVLNGPYRIYNQDYQLVEERFYAGGFPVNTWTLYYPNGMKAREIYFPDSVMQWEDSRLEGPQPSAGQIYSAHYYHPTLAKEVFYSMGGRKQKERSLQLVQYGKSYQILPTSDERIYNFEGQIVTQKQSFSFYDKSRTALPALGETYLQEKFWINDRLYKEAHYEVPSP